METDTTSQGVSRPTIYPSGIDTWIVVMLMLAPLTSLVTSLYLLQQGQGSGGERKLVEHHRVQGGGGDVGEGGGR